MNELKNQPTLAPTRKWKFGAVGAAVMTALIPVIFPALEAYDPAFAAQWGPVIAAVLSALGFAVPAYVVKNRA